MGSKKSVPGNTYQAYLLRIWQDTPNSPRRFSLEHAGTGKRYGFADLESLFSFLNQEIRSHDTRKGDI